MTENLINCILSEKLIAIIRGVEKDKLIPLGEALYEGGIRLMEITYSADGKVSDEDTAKNIELLREHFCGKMNIGAGTVITPYQAELTKKAGGEFIISPDVNAEVIEKTKECEMVSIPGALTPTEARCAKRAGADFVKLFPVSNLGIPYIKAIMAPLTDIRFLAVGGINEDNISDYIKAGVCGCGVGSNIVDRKLIAENKFDIISEKAKKYVMAVK